MLVAVHPAPLTVIGYRKLGELSVNAGRVLTHDELLLLLHSRLGNDAEEPA